MKKTLIYLSANSITYKIIYFFQHILISSGIYLLVEGKNKPFTSKKDKNPDENISSKSIHYKKVEKFCIF